MDVEVSVVKVLFVLFSPEPLGQKCCLSFGLSVALLPSWLGLFTRPPRFLSAAFRRRLFSVFLPALLPTHHYLMTSFGCDKTLANLQSVC